MGLDRAIDITPGQRNTVLALLKRYLPHTTAWVYGSRAKWTARPQSDLDLVVFATPEQHGRVSDLREEFEGSNLPFRVDLFVWDAVPEQFRKHIEAEHEVLVATDQDGGITASEREYAFVHKEAKRQRGAGGEWCQTTLGDAIELKRGYDLPQRERRPGPVPVVSSSGLTDHHSESKVQGPGVVTGRYGTLGQVFFIPNDFWPLNTTLYVRDFKGNDPRFIGYFLRGVDFLAYSDKAAVPGLNRNHLHQEIVRIPTDIREQRAIAHILGTLDDKIELNRRMNATLEALARALFTSWFVNFDPVRAKMAGRDTGLPKDIADMFPDRLVDSELGEIPEGWPVESLADHFEAVKGVSYKGSGLGGGGVPLHNLNSVHEGGGYKYEGIKFYSGEYADRHRVRSGDVIVANTEQGHDRLLIGHAAIVPVSFGTDGIASHHIYRLRSRRVSWLSTRFLLFLLNSPRMHDLVSGYANGTTVNMLPLDGVQRPPVAVPPRALVETFDVVASCSEHRREQTVRESRTLTYLRDTLLPKLVSGELRVNVLEAAFGRGDRSVSVAAQEA